MTHRRRGLQDVRDRQPFFVITAIGASPEQVSIAVPRSAINKAMTVGGPGRRLTASGRWQGRERRTGEVVNPNSLRGPLNADRHRTAVRRDRRIRGRSRRRVERLNAPTGVDPHHSAIGCPGIGRNIRERSTIRHGELRALARARILAYPVRKRDGRAGHAQLGQVEGDDEQFLVSGVEEMSAGHVAARAGTSDEQAPFACCRRSALRGVSRPIQDRSRP